jgi:hypothetical protein
MDVTATLIAVALAAGLLTFASWRTSKPVDPLKVRLAPWRTIILIAGCILIFLAVHLLTLLGMKTDQPQ